MDIIEKEMQKKDQEDKEKVVESSEMVVEGEKDEKSNENEMEIEEQNKNGDADVNGNGNATDATTTATPVTALPQPDGVRVLVEYWVSESGIGGIHDGRQFVDSTGWQHIDVESESFVSEEKLMAMQAREKELKDRDASVR